MDPLLMLLIGIVVAFAAGSAGAAAMILLNDRKMAAVERVKRRILYGPEPEPEWKGFDFGAVNFSHERTAAAIMAKHQAALGQIEEYQKKLHAMSISPMMSKAVNLAGMSEEEIRKLWQDRP